MNIVFVAGDAKDYVEYANLQDQTYLDTWILVVGCSCL